MEVVCLFHSTEFRSIMTVELISPASPADDNSVIFAAQVSTKGEKSRRQVESPEGDAKKAGLINFLMRERHGTPFEHNMMTFYVEAPIFVFRELMRHRVASYNEESGRYRELRPVFYVPNASRKLIQKGKAGAYRFESGSYQQTRMTDGALRRICNEAYASYLSMLNQGIAREVARMVLPVSIYSCAYVTMNSRALMNFLSLRTINEGSKYPSYPMEEITMVADQMEEIFAFLMPLTHNAFHAHGRVSP